MKNDSTLPKLLFIGEHFTGRIYELSQEKTTVGRGDHNMLVLHHRSVSHAHCEILVHGPEVIVPDIGSANGTFVNGVRVTPQSQVKSEQIVRFGAVEARLDLGFPIGGDPASDLSAIHTLRRINREKEREEKREKPTSARATFESDADAGANRAQQTVLIPATSPVEGQMSAPHAPEVPNQKIEKRKAIWVALLLAVGFAFIAG